MIHKRYYSPFENDEILRPQRVIEDPAPPPPPPPERKEKQMKKFKCASLPFNNRESRSPLGFLAELKLDDLIIIGLILLLLFEEQDERDMPLIIGLVVLFILEFIDNDHELLT